MNHRSFRLASLILVFVLAGAVRAAETEDRVHELFERKCADCHDKEDKIELSAHTDLRQLRADEKYVVAGNAENSPLFKLVNLPDGDKKRMPKSKASQPKPPLTSDEKGILRDWIQGPSAAGPARKFIGYNVVAHAVLADLQNLTLTAGVRGHVRYLTLSNLYNQRDDQGAPLRSEDEMEIFRAGVNKLLNSLSWKPSITLATPLDPERTLLRVDLDAYGISPDVWKALVSGYPFRVEGRGTAELGEAAKIAGDYPLMRADFFVFALSQPPFYHNALQIPGGRGQNDADVELESKINLFYDAALKDPEAVRLGFQHSGVSLGNRLLERLPRPDGAYYWRSYDFDNRRQNDRGGDLFKAPLGPIKAGICQTADLKFSQDGGEIIFSLPNGLQAYMLVNARGARLDEAPSTVVHDKGREDGRIINGISCMKCHVNGMFSTKHADEVLSTCSNLNMSAADRVTLTRLYNQERANKYLAQDTERFLAAQAQCGHNGGADPVSLLYRAFLNPMSTRQLASETGVDDPALLKSLHEADNPEIRSVLAKLDGRAPVERVVFDKFFPAIIKQLGLGLVPPGDRLAFTEFGGLVDDPQRPGNPDEGGITVSSKKTPLKVIRLVDENAPAPEAGPSASHPSDSQNPAKKVVCIDASGNVISGGNAAPSKPSDAPSAQTPAGKRPPVKIPANATDEEAGDAAAALAKPSPVPGH